MKKSQPMRCPKCMNTKDYYGRLVFDGEDIPTCPNHRRVDPVTGQTIDEGPLLVPILPRSVPLGV